MTTSRPASKPMILVPMGFYLPGEKSGGPIRSMQYITDALGDEFDFRVLAMDRDLGEAHPYPEIPLKVWVKVGKAHVMYLPPESRSVVGMSRLYAEIPFDLLYLNSFFFFKWSILPLLLRKIGWIPPKPVVIAPRGQFTSGAISLKRDRKQLYLLLARALNLYSGTRLQATSQLEAVDFQRQLGLTLRKGDVPVTVARIIPLTPGSQKQQNRPEKKSGQLKIVFLARISPMKNLGFALSVLRNVSGEVDFDLYGPLEDEAYWSQCREIIDALPPHVRVSYHGAVEHSQVAEVISRYHLFFMPTLGENYGHVIAEALNLGCPVLISDRTPWQDLEREEAGWDLPLDRPDLFEKALSDCITMDETRYSALSEGAVRFAIKRSDREAVIEENRQMLKMELNLAQSRDA